MRRNAAKKMKREMKIIAVGGNEGKVERWKKYDIKRKC